MVWRFWLVTFLLNIRKTTMYIWIYRQAFDRLFQNSSSWQNRKKTLLYGYRSVDVWRSDNLADWRTLSNLYDLDFSFFNLTRTICPYFQSLFGFTTCTKNYICTMPFPFLLTFCQGFKKKMFQYLYCCDSVFKYELWIKHKISFYCPQF